MAPVSNPSNFLQLEGSLTGTRLRLLPSGLTVYIPHSRVTLSCPSGVQLNQLFPAPIGTFARPVPSDFIVQISLVASGSPQNAIRPLGPKSALANTPGGVVLLVKFVSCCTDEPSAFETYIWFHDVVFFDFP